MGNRLVAFDPLREVSHRALMQAYAAAGEKSLALQHYTTCRDLRELSGLRTNDSEIILSSVTGWRLPAPNG